MVSHIYHVAFVIIINHFDSQYSVSKIASSEADASELLDNLEDILP